MAKEPYIKSDVYDMTGGLLPAPADDGYNIAIAVYTPTGPIEKTKVTSQKDFINKYMTGTSMRPDDNMSAIFAYMLLAQNPLYVVRGCPVTFLEGISSKGNHLLFDKNFNLVPSYFKFRLNEIKDALSYYYIKHGSYAYVAGDDEKIDSAEIDGANKISVSANKSIDELISGLMESVSENDATFKLLKADDATIIARGKLDAHSTNIGKFNEIARSSIYKHAASTHSKVSELNYLSENGTTYYFQGANTKEPTSLSNPVAIESPDNKETIDAAYFMLKVIAKTQALFSGSLTINLNDFTSGEKHAKFSDSTVPGIKCVGSGVNISKSATIKKGTVGSYSLKVKDTVSAYSALPSENLTVKDKYVVEHDENHDGKKYIYTAISANKFDDGELFVEFDAPSIKVTIDGEEFIYIASSEISEDPSVLAIDADNTAEFITSVIDSVIAKNPNLYHSDSDASLKVTGNIEYYSNATSGSLSSDVFTVEVDTEDDFTYYYYLSTDANNAGYITHPFLWLTVGNYFYYTGTLPEGFSVKAGLTTVRMSKTSVNKEEFISLLYTNLYSTQLIGKFGENFISSAKKELDYDENTMNISSSMVVQNTDEQFAIVQKFPSTESVFQFSYNKDADDDRIIDLKLNFKDGSVVENWTMSFVPGVSDGYGIDQWYTRVDSNNFKVVSLTGEGELGSVEDSYTSPAFGNQIGVPDYDVQYLKDAIKTIPEYEDGVHYDMVCDAGITDPGLGTTCEALADELFAIYPASLPENTLNVDDLISYVGAANFKSWNTRMLAAGDRIPIAGFSKPMPGSYKLILQVLGLYRNKSIEFAPNFDLNHGSVGTSNLIQSWKKPEREKLLTYKIETLKGGITTPYFINDNVTAQPSKSYMSEDQNVRMTNTAVHLMEDFVDPFKGELNTTATRQKVQDGANRAIQDRLFKGKQYSPALYKAVCNDSNNPADVIDGNQLVVDLYASFTPSIKYVLVKHHVVPLSQAGNY